MEVTSLFFCKCLNCESKYNISIKVSGNEGKSQDLGVKSLGTWFRPDVTLERDVAFLGLSFHTCKMMVSKSIAALNLCYH